MTEPITDAELAELARLVDTHPGGLTGAASYSEAARTALPRLLQEIRRLRQMIDNA